MPNLLVRDVPEHVVETLKRRAAAHRRSLQQEVVGILEQAAQPSHDMTPAELAAAIRQRLIKKGITFTDSTPLIREDRAR